MILIADICTQFRNESSIFAEVAESITPTMHLIKYFIDLLVDFDTTQLRNKFVLNSGVDSVFDERKYNVCNFVQFCLIKKVINKNIYPPYSYLYQQ